MEGKHEEADQPAQHGGQDDPPMSASQKKKKKREERARKDAARRAEREGGFPVAPALSVGGAFATHRPSAKDTSRSPMVRGTDTLAPKRRLSRCPPRRGLVDEFVAQLTPAERNYCVGWEVLVHCMDGTNVRVRVTKSECIRDLKRKLQSEASGSILGIFVQNCPDELPDELSLKQVAVRVLYMLPRARESSLVALRL
jgi:hypothetical protein